MLVLAVPLDALVRPRPGLSGRRAAGIWLLAWMMMAAFGLFLAICGNVPVAAALALALLALLALVSNAKRAMLGEPLHFSDLALIGAIFRHPQFYLSAIRPWQRLLVGLAALGLLGLLASLFVADLAPHLAGVGLMAAGLAVLVLSLGAPPFTALAMRPDADGDVCRLGLLPVLLIYWRRWRATEKPLPCPPIERASPAGTPELPVPELLVIVQCESFADPVELFPGAEALPALRAARARAWQWGRLEVSGFGAYTMRTEYGLLFGRDEEALGFRRYDPFLTALDDISYALPARLKPAGWTSLFLHPHDMRFYGRDRIMPAAGFAELVADDRFAPPAPGEGRYVTDAAMADEIVTLAQKAAGPTVLYAVTIENHGPWAGDEVSGKRDLVGSYLRLARNSDAMLETLVSRIGALKRPAMLVFFGDHRPSIPGTTQPGGARHTPYVMMRFDASGCLMEGARSRVDLTPAQLHHAMLDALLGSSR